MAIAHVAVEIARAPSWTVDDAWITARYASNLVRHGVFAFNVEGPHVEGITSLLYGISAAIFIRLGISPIAGLNALSIGSLFVSGVLVFRIATGALRVPPIFAALLSWIWLAIPEHVTHATSGLETEAFLALSFASIDGFVRAWNKPHAKLFPVACVLVCLCRPEGLAITGVLAVSLAYRHRRHLARLRSSVAGIALALLLLSGFRLLYFDAFLPNTFYAKSRGAFSPEVVLDLLRLVYENIIAFALVALVVLVVARPTRMTPCKSGPRARSLIVASGVLLIVFLATYRHKDVMNYSRRFAMHALPWLYTLVMVLFAMMDRAVRRHRRRLLQQSRLFAVVGVGGALGTTLWLPTRMHTHEQEIHKMTAHAFVRLHWYEPALRVIREAAPTARSLAVIPDAGFLPYETGLPTIDFGRLSDRYLAREARTSSDVVEYFFRAHADVVVFSHYGEDRLFNADAKYVMVDPRFSRDYRRVAEFRDARAHGISVYTRSTRASE